jgi:integrase
LNFDHPRVVTYLLNRLVERFGPYSLASISPALLSAYRDERLKAVSNQTVVHELGMVSRVFKAAALDWGIALPQGIPTTLVRKPRVSNDRTRRLEANEKELLLEALRTIKTPWLHAAFVLAIETAGRQSELLSLTWADVNLQRRVARLRGKSGGVTKSGDPWRDVPLSPAACAVLKALPRSTKGVVLPMSQNALQLGWKRLCARARKTHVLSQLSAQLGAKGFDKKAQAGEVSAVTYKKREPMPLTKQLLEHIGAMDKVMVDLHFHDLRHEATSVLAERLLMHELMKVTGHKSAKVLSRYYHPRTEDLAAKLA